MISKDEFYEYINKLLEKEQQKKHKWMLSKNLEKITFCIFLFNLFVLFISFSFVLYSITNSHKHIFISLLIFVILTTTAILIGKLSYKITTRIKESIENYDKQIIDYLLKDYKYKHRPRAGIPEEIFNESNFLHEKCGNCFGEDSLFIYLTDDITLELSDITAYPINKNVIPTKKKIKNSYFSGIFGYVKFPYDFDCVISINAEYRNDKLKLEKVILESISFNENFTIYSDDQIESRRLLTPLLMDNLLELNRIGNPLMFSILKNKIYIGLPKRNLFKTKKIKKGDITSVFRDYYDPIRLIINILEILKNNKILKTN